MTLLMAFIDSRHWLMLQSYSLLMKLLPKKVAEPEGKHSKKDMNGDSPVRPIEDRPDSKEIRVLHLFERALHRAIHCGRLR